MNTPLSSMLPGLVLFITTVSAFCTSFAVSSVSVVMPLGRLGDLVGRQAVFGWGMLVYALGSLAATMATAMRWGFGLSAALFTLGIGASLARGPGGR